ncbi:hypothetical protein AWC38_SpisGene23334, partial [Stylophora pistillata]
KPTLVFLLFVATANLILANPVRSARSSSKKVVDYKVQISETGTEYNETIEVDTEKQTKLFKVPAHNDVDKSNILHDLKTELDKDKAKIIDIKWTVDSEMADRSVLSEELANFCPEYPIYQVKLMYDSLTSTRSDTGVSCAQVAKAACPTGISVGVTEEEDPGEYKSM